jgi:hypothetical protein
MEYTLRSGKLSSVPGCDAISLAAASCFAFFINFELPGEGVGQNFRT